MFINFISPDASGSFALSTPLCKKTIDISRQYEICMDLEDVEEMFI